MREKPDLFGGSLIQVKDFQKRVLQRIETATALDSDNMAFILDAVLQEASGYWGLVWSGSPTIQGNWELDPKEPWVKENRVVGAACFGDLTIDGDLLLRHEDHWPPLFVAGTLRVRNLIQTGPPLFVLGDLHASGYVMGHSFLRVRGDLTAAGYIYGCKGHGNIEGHLIAGRTEARTFDARGWPIERRKIRAAFVPEVLVHGWIDEEEILYQEHAGLPVWRDPADVVEEPPPPPPPPIPEVRGVDPVELGALIAVPEAEDRLADWIEATVSRDRGVFTEPLHAVLQRHPDGQFLLLPAGTHLRGDLELEWRRGVEWIDQNGIVGIACEGDLTVDGDVLNWTVDWGPMLFVRGSLKLRNLIKGGSSVMVLGNVEASGLVVGDDNHASLRIAGDLSAHAYFLLDHYGYVGGEVKAPVLNDREDDMQDLVVPMAFADEWDMSPDSKLLWRLQWAGIEVLLEKP